MTLNASTLYYCNAVLLLQVLRERLGVYCILALTATATHQTAVSVATNLGIVQENIIRGPTLPDNLHVSVSCDQDRDQVNRIISTGEQNNTCIVSRSKRLLLIERYF